jgi:DNA segregation ATPase FtsK/SpoIIIE, S-DNA-T family
MISKRTRLNLQADKIEMVLAHHKLAAQVYGGSVTPNTVRFDLNVAPNVKINKLASLAEEIALALGAANVRIHRDGAAIRVEVPRERKSSVLLTDLCDQVGRIPALTSVLGLDGNGQPLLLRLSSPSVAHILVAGTTGSGKTAAVRSLLLSLARFNRPNDMRFVLIDPKGRGFESLKDLPHLLYPAVRETADAVTALQKLVTHMERRDREQCDRPRVVIAIDELADLLQTGGKQIEAPLTRLVQRGREAGFHVIAATQKPSSKVMSGIMKSNFPTRLVGRVASPEDARSAAGIGGTGAEKLAGHGEFLLVAEGQVIRFQSAYAGSEHMAKMIGELRQPAGRIVLLDNPVYRALQPQLIEG